MKTRCIIVDDEPLAVELLQSYVEKTPFLKLVGTFTSALSLIGKINKLQPDLIYLDMHMPEIDGITFAHAIPSYCKVIFTTSFDKYAAQNYHFNVVDYLLKPISYNDFLVASEKVNLQQDMFYNQVSAQGRKKHDTIWIKSENKYVQIELSNLAYVEGLKDYVNFHFANGARPVLTLMRMKKVVTILPEEFVRIHKSYIVNMDHVNYMERGYVICAGQRLSMGLNYKESFMDKLDVVN